MFLAQNKSFIVRKSIFLSTTLILVAILCNPLLAQENDFKEFSYSEFYNLIQSEKDTVFKLENAYVKFTPETDEEFKGHFIRTDSLFQSETFSVKTIDKKLILKNVIFKNNVTENETFQGYNVTTVYGALINFHFTKSVSLNEVYALNIYNSVFESKLNYINDSLSNMDRNAVADYSRSTYLVGNKFKNAYFEFKCEFNYLQIHNNFFQTSEKYWAGLGILLNGVFGIQFTNNRASGMGFTRISIVNSEWITLADNFFETVSLVNITDLHGLNRLSLKNNTFNKPVILEIDKFFPNYRIDWQQFNEMMIANSAYGPYFSKQYFNDRTYNFSDKKNIDFYKDSVLIYNGQTYSDETGFLGTFYNYYKSRFDTEKANAVYVKLKNMETARLAYLYKKSPSFDTYFTWKINQFLKVFSAYGTKPSKAIIFSLNVILMFAIIYLFFPNSWDAHGKNRIVHRFSFFMKYMNRKQGIHEVYLEEKQADIMAYKDFKNLIENSSEKVPGFFKATALPLYRWAISGTKLTATLLSKVDVMKGTWEEVPAKKRWWKFVLLIGAFLIAIMYDLLIKMLNALMLSVNTFTTLGFGEIPIKGLPRYLAIVQGFIGWFMLTIFSVSLISQLLN